MRTLQVGQTTQDGTALVAVECKIFEIVPARKACSCFSKPSMCTLMTTARHWNVRMHIRSCKSNRISVTKKTMQKKIFSTAIRCMVVSTRWTLLTAKIHKKMAEAFYAFLSSSDKCIGSAGFGKTCISYYLLPLNIKKHVFFKPDCGR